MMRLSYHVVLVPAYANRYLTLWMCTWCRYERELKTLRAELEARSRNVVDKRRLLELDEQRKRAEEDKMTAIKALEVRSQEFMREKEEKKKLEQVGDGIA